MLQLHTLMVQALRKLFEKKYDRKYTGSDESILEIYQEFCRSSKGTMIEEMYDREWK